MAVNVTTVTPTPTIVPATGDCVIVGVPQLSVAVAGGDGSVRNALERARLRQANRLVTAGARVGRDDLLRIEPEDFLASRVLAPASNENKET